MTVGAIVGEALTIHGLARNAREHEERVANLLQTVGLHPEHRRRYPHEFSGGQRQRIGIARALAPQPDLLVADEPVSALDLSVRAQILNLLAGVQKSRGIAILFIAHDLALVEQIADRIAVLYLGRIVEEGPAAALLARPLHPYTASLLAAVPRVRRPGDAPRSRLALPAFGEPPSASNPPEGCPFHPRCPIAQERCRRERPLLLPAGPVRRVACHSPGEIGAAAIAASGAPTPPRTAEDGTFPSS
jgi:oligopeptide/dipeptide ABC transporter ATP-binding protein